MEFAFYQSGRYPWYISTGSSSSDRQITLSAYKPVACLDRRSATPLPSLRQCFTLMLCSWIFSWICVMGSWRVQGILHFPCIMLIASKESISRVNCWKFCWQHQYICIHIWCVGFLSLKWCVGFLSLKESTLGLWPNQLESFMIIITKICSRLDQKIKRNLIIIKRGLLGSKPEVRFFFIVILQPYLVFVCIHIKCVLHMYTY